MPDNIIIAYNYVYYNYVLKMNTTKHASEKGAHGSIQ